MGTVDLLSREGEIAIAKRIEAGQEAMISGLCESPLTLQAILDWRDDIIAEKITLREVIDLESLFEESPNKKELSKKIKEAKKRKEQEEKEGNRVETIVKIAVLVWSASMLTLSYYEPPSGKKIVDFDPTFIASIFSASTASLGFSIKKKKDTIVDNKNSKVGIK